MNPAERFDDPQNAVLTAIYGVLAGLQTAMPCIITKVDLVKVTCECQPAIKAFINQQDGSTVAAALPLLVDVPLVFPRGGGCTLTFPVAPGDECLVVFASRAIDMWWQSGGVQIPNESRRHDLSDGFAIVGPFSQQTKISGISATDVQMRSNDGAAYVGLNPTSHQVTVQTSGNIVAGASGNISATAGGNIAATATGSISATAGTVANITAMTAITLQAPNINLLGITNLGGPLVQTNVTGLGSTATMIGPLNVTNDVTGLGKSLGTHTHGGVQPGGGNTGGPN